MRRLVGCVGAAVCLVLVGLSQASAANIYTQANILRGNDTALTCSGVSHGKCTISEVAPGVGTSPTQSGTFKVTCSLNKALPNTTYQVAWTCTTVARGCHDQACGYTYIGTVTTGATGAGTFIKSIGANLYPGYYVHLDVMGGGQVYASVFAGMPIGIPPSAPTQGGAGDPAKIK